HGVGTARAVRIYKTYGDKAVELVRENPYRLATDVWGIGFKTADELASSLGIEKTSPLRARAAVRFVLQELSGDGHAGFPEAGVIDQTAELLDVAREIVVAAIEAEREAGDVVRENQVVRWISSEVVENSTHNPTTSLPHHPTTQPLNPSSWLYLKP